VPSIKHILVSISLPGLFFLPANAQSGTRNVSIPSDKSQPVRVPRFDQAPVIDGKIDDEAWRQAAVFKDFLQTKPGDNIAPSKPTEARIGYDAKTLYLAFRCFDEPDKIRASVAKRDNVFEDDNVRVFLDTFNDQRRAYVLGWNPFGIQQDGIISEGQEDADYSIDIVMDSKGVVDSEGWTVEVAIPFKSLRYKAGKDRAWGIHIFREFFRFDNEENSWMPISRDIAPKLSQAGHITGLEGISTERTLEIIPTFTISETGRRVSTLPRGAPGLDPGRFVNEPLKFDPGLTLKYGITPTVILDFTVNPDFAQVEADQTVVTANQRFPIFFEEKRPFFLEGIEIFRTPLQAVHTRAIVDPDLAAKLSGKLGRNSFGLIVASDKAPGNFSSDESVRPQNLRFADKNAYIAVLRAKRDIGGKDSHIGFLATSYNFIEKHNQLGGIDGRFRIDPKTYAAFQVLGTTSRRCFSEPEKDLHRPPATDPCFVNGNTRNYYRTGNGFGYQYELDFTGRNFGWRFNGNGRTQDYRADVGFTRRTNVNAHNAFIRFSNDPRPNATLISWRLTGALRPTFDWQGRMVEWYGEPEIELQLKHNIQIEASFLAGYERLIEREFGAARTTTQAGAFFGGPERSTYFRRFVVGIEASPAEKFSGSLSVTQDNNVFDLDFGAEPKYPRVSLAALADPDAPLDPGPGSQLNIEAGISLQPTDEFSASLNYEKSRLRRHDSGLVAFDENIFSFRSTYQFSRFVFTRARVDYNTLESNVRAQFLFGYTPNPGTAFYVGYNDDLNRNGYNPFTDQFEPGFRRNGRTFFIKMSYLIRKSFGG
jgi:hypothetical protein